MIVSSYKENNIRAAERLLSPKVFKAFEEQTDTKNSAESF